MRIADCGLIVDCGLWMADLLRIESAMARNPQSAIRNTGFWHEMALVGRIARAHGIRGQVIVNLETDFPEERFQPGAELFIERKGHVEPLTITTVRFHRERPIVGLRGVETVDDAAALAAHELRVPVERLAALPPGTYYRHALIGCR